VHLSTKRIFVTLVPLFALPIATGNTPSRQPIPDYDEAGLTRMCETGLAAARKSIGVMERRQGSSTFFEEWNRLAMVIDDVMGAADLLVNVHPVKAVRSAGQACLQKVTELNTELFQNTKLFRRVSQANPINERQVKFKKDLVAGFADGGVTLQPLERKRVKDILEKLTELDQLFRRNVRDDATKVTFTAHEMEGLPQAFLQSIASDRDTDSNYVLASRSSSYSTFMRVAKNDAARRRFYIARQNRGGEANLEILFTMFKLRQELAVLQGHPTYASYALRRKMARNPETVMNFLARVKDVVTSVATREVEELREAKSRYTGIALADTKVERWDVDFYQEVLRHERFDVDQERLRKYFPTNSSVDFALLIAQRLYGLKFREVTVPTWSPDVRYLDVLDSKTNQFIAGIYLDLYPREGKYGGGVAFPIRGESRIASRKPLCALVVNLSRDGLTQSQLSVLVHEFGHTLHCALSNADYNPQSGLNVKTDFVEAPSRMFEEWTRREQGLDLFNQVCPECARLTRVEINQLQAARRFGEGIGYEAELLRSVYDMELSTKPEPPLELWKKLESATSLGHAKGTMFPASFSHIAGGMAAGYYSYLWSEALALDMLSAFTSNMLDPSVGARFREYVLSQGAQKEEIDLVRNFLGHAPSSQVFFTEISGKH
jgi:thimet oligopeptidase